MHKTIRAAIMAIAAFNSLLGLLCVGAAQHVYPFAIPFVVTMFLCFIAGIAAIDENNRVVNLILNGFVMMSFVLFIFVVGNWPGGDDGPGMILVGGIGPPLLIAVVLAIVSTIQIVREKYHR